MNVLILAAGNDGHEDSSDRYPLFLSELDGELILERLVRNCMTLSPSRVIFAIRKDDARNHHLNDIIKLLVPDAIIVEINGKTHGAACTALLAVDQMDLNDELLITSATDIVDVSLGKMVEDFRAGGANGGTLVFDSLHPRYSFVRIEGESNVVEVAEKRPISRNATVGIYWFLKAADFVGGCQRMITKAGHVNGIYYISPIFNELLLQQKKITAARIRTDQYHPIKSGKQVANFEILMEQLRSFSEA